MRLNFSAARDDVFKEWDELKRFDVVFLVQRNKMQNTETRRTWSTFEVRRLLTFAMKKGFRQRRFPGTAERYEQQQASTAAAGCDGRRTKNPSGYDRVFTLEVDCAQYQRDLETFDGDVTRLHEMYKRFNCVIRRRPKENNFKAILACIRDCLNQNMNAPEWLQDVFLGYGDPSSASPDALERENVKNERKLTSKILFGRSTFTRIFPGRRFFRFRNARPAIQGYICH